MTNLGDGTWLLISGDSLRRAGWVTTAQLIPEHLAAENQLENARDMATRRASEVVELLQRRRSKGWESPDTTLALDLGHVLIATVFK